jgi:hypothetical protein
MVEVAREERVGHFVESYYRSTAEVFEFSHGRERTERYAEQEVIEGLQALTKLGLRVRADKERISELVEVLRRIDIIGANPKLEETISQLEGVGFMGKQKVAMYTKFLFMTDKEFKEWLNMYERFRSLLTATVSKAAEQPNILKNDPRKRKRRKLN